jgi:hypothetical protein
LLLFNIFNIFIINGKKAVVGANTPEIEAALIK